MENGATTNQGVVGHILKGVSTVVNGPFCASLGPNFLNLFSKYHCCPKEYFAPRVLQSYEDFCKLFKNANPQLKECLTASIVDVRINVNRYIDAVVRAGKCCNTCPVSTFNAYVYFFTVI